MMSQEPCGDFYRAYVEVLMSERALSDFVAAAGFGLTGIGIHDIMAIDFKPGEEVDSTRVSEVMDSLIRISDTDRTDFKILSYDVLKIGIIHNQQPSDEQPKETLQSLF